MARIIDIEMNENGSWTVKYASGCSRTYKSRAALPKTAKAWLKEQREEARAEERGARRFTVGGKAVCGNDEETILKVSKCYVWMTYCGYTDEVQKRRIRKDSYGNEYVEWQETGWGRGCNSYYKYKAA